MIKVHGDGLQIFSEMDKNGSVLKFYGRDIDQLFVFPKSTFEITNKEYLDERYVGNPYEIPEYSWKVDKNTILYLTKTFLRIQGYFSYYEVTWNFRNLNKERESEQIQDICIGAVIH